MSREQAETYLRLLAESELRDLAARPADGLRRPAQARRTVLAARALCAVGAIDARTAWQLFHLNWLAIAAMGSLLALGLPITDLSLEPVAYGVTLAIAAALVAVAYCHRMVKGQHADPKLIFSLGTIGSSERSASAPWPISRRPGPPVRPVSPTLNGGKL